MTMKKIFIVAIVIIILFAAAFLASWIFGNKNAQPTINTPAGTQAASSPIQLGKASRVYKDLPAGNTLTIGTPRGTVMVKNFYTADPPVNDGGDLVIKETANYSIVYDPTDGSFWLAITGTPFNTWQKTAEQDLLQTLAIDKTDACKLKATAGIVYKPGDPNNGKSFPLTFCAAGVIQ